MFGDCAVRDGGRDNLRGIKPARAHDKRTHRWAYQLGLCWFSAESAIWAVEFLSARSCAVPSSDKLFEITTMGVMPAVSAFIHYAGVRDLESSAFRALPHGHPECHQPGMRRGGVFYLSAAASPVRVKEPVGCHRCTVTMRRRLGSPRRARRDATSRQRLPSMKGLSAREHLAASLTPFRSGRPLIRRHLDISDELVGEYFRGVGAC